MCGSPAEGTSCSITLDPSGLLLGSVDFYDVDEDGAEYIGSDFGSSSIDALSPIPNCQFQGADPISSGPFIVEPTPPNIVQTVGSEFDWSFSFFDDGDRSFVFDLDDYPFEFIDELFVVGIDATNADEYDNLAFADLVITEEDGL
jgi:hypothetical protein